MAKKKNSILFQEDWYNLTKPLTDEGLGKLFRAIMKSVFEGEDIDIESFDPMLQMALNFILPKIEEAQEKYQEVCKKRKDAAKAMHSKQKKDKDTSAESAEQNMQNDANSANASKCKQVHANASKCMQKHYDNDNDNESTNVDISSDEDIIVSSNEDTPSTRVEDDSPLAFENVWKSYGKKGTKATAKSRYNKLSTKKKEAIAQYIPYYLAFTVPQYRKGFEVFISREQWKNLLQDPNGNEIPFRGEDGKPLFHVADIDKFKDWFNKLVSESNIPQVVEVTPDRLVNLNICYTLYPKIMTRAVSTVLHSKRYQEMASKGMITFDYIFNPKNIIKICEQGENN